MALRLDDFGLNAGGTCFVGTKRGMVKPFLMYNTLTGYICRIFPLHVVSIHTPLLVVGPRGC